MSKRNPIKSMSGNMWHALRELRRCGLIDLVFSDHVASQATWADLKSRGLAMDPESKAMPGVFVEITDLGRMVCDAFTEGREQG
jgi:hypothetical protein